MSAAALAGTLSGKNRTGQEIISTDQVLHLPLAPQIVARTRFSSPTSPNGKAILINEGLQLIEQSLEANQDGKPIRMVAITGPGDPLSSPDITLSAVQAIKERFPQLQIGLKTLGFNSDRLAGELARSGINLVELQVDGVRAEILMKLYAWIRPALKTLPIAEAVKQLLKAQQNGVVALKFHNIAVHINTTLYPGYNLDHVSRICSEMKELGADSISLCPYTPPADAEVVLDPPSQLELVEATQTAAKHLPVHDSLLTISEAQAKQTARQEMAPPLKADKKRPFVAVVSSDGYHLNQHLGHARNFLIYGRDDQGKPTLIGNRQAPLPGGGAGRWLQAATILSDCFALLAAGAGESPRRTLGETGVKVLVGEGQLDKLLAGLLAERKESGQH